MVTDHCGLCQDFLLVHACLCWNLQADEEAALVVETTSSCVSACGSAPPSSRQHRTSECLTVCKDGRTPDVFSLSQALDAVLDEPENISTIPLSRKSRTSAEFVAGGSFCEEVRCRMQKLQHEMQAREKTISSLNVQIHSQQQAHRHESMVWSCMARSCSALPI